VIKIQVLGYNGATFHRLIGFTESELETTAATYSLTNKQQDGTMPYYALAASQAPTVEADGITEATESEVDEIRGHY